MNPDRWLRIETLFHAVRERAAGERSAFLDQACTGDESLRHEIESLLTEHDRSSLESGAFDLAAEWLRGRQQTSMLKKLGRFQVLSLLGKGGMGEVYLAEDQRLGRKVALKLLNPDFAAQDHLVRRFEQEARAASALNHPNIVTIYDIDHLDGAHFIATEFVEGRTLRAFMQHEPLAIAHAIDLAAQVAGALEAAHAAGIIHRDIKPENIMVRTDGVVKILDFGLAKLTEQRVQHTDTDPGTIMGTPAYMSPEQARGWQIDTRSDIFSLGVVLYEMIAGKPPFSGRTTSHLIVAILEDDPAPLVHDVETVSDNLAAIVQKALAKSRDERYQNVAALRADLRTIHHDGESTVAFPRSQMPRSRPAVDSIAVLPLFNADADASAEYLCEGITESIINSLAQLPRLRVIPRSTVFRYKNSMLDPQEIGRALNVRTVLIGRVLHVGDTLIVRAELVDVQAEAQLWGGEYRHNQTDIFAIQEEIATRTAEMLRVRLSGSEQQRLARRSTENVEAYHLYLKGRYHWNKLTEDGLRKGMDFFNQAIEADPTYAQPYSGLADSFVVLGDDYLSPNDTFPKAKAYALKALSLDDSLAEPHASMGVIKFLYEWDYPAAETELRRALEINSGYAIAHQLYGHLLAAMERQEEAIAALTRSIELDPLSLAIGASLGLAYHSARQFERAIEQYRKTIEIEPYYFFPYLCTGVAYEQLGRYDEAIAILEQAAALSEGDPRVTAQLGYMYARSGQREAAQQALQQLTDRATRTYTNPVLFAIVYSGLGDKDRAFAWLEQSYEGRSTWLPFLPVEPRFDNLRSDPRFTDLIKRISSSRIAE